MIRTASGAADHAAPKTGAAERVRGGRIAKREFTGARFAAVNLPRDLPP